jgi:hypothetical protein
MTFGGSRHRSRTVPWLGSLAAAALLSVATGPVGAASVRPATAVGGASVALSTSAAGAAGVTYTVDFTTSAGGALTRSQGQIVLTVPTGTKVYGTWQLTDLTTDKTGTARTATLKTSGGVTELTVTTNIAIGADNQVQFVLTGVDSPTTAGTDALSVSTTADTTASSASFTLTTANAVSQITPISMTTNVVASEESTFAFGFTVSATGALVPGYGALRLIGESGTEYVPTSPTGPAPNITVADLTTGQTSGEVALTASEQDLGGNGTYLTVPEPIAINAGDQVSVTLRGASHDGIPYQAQDITISTSSDSVTATTPTFVQTEQGMAAGAGVVNASTVAGATTSYTITVTTSNQGTLDPQQGALSLEASTGTNFDPGGTTPTYTVTDLTTGQTGTYGIGPGVIFTNGGSFVIIPLYTAVAGGDTVQVVWNGVTNLTTVGWANISVTTSTDLVPVLAVYQITAS